MRQNIVMNQSANPDTAGLIAVVLCGGQSSRMGRDKGLIERDGVCWAAWMGRKLSSFGLPVVYSIRAGQEAAYSAVLPHGWLIPDAMGIGGPLNGLFSVHERFPGNDLLVLACDMQDMDEATIGELIGEYRKGGRNFMFIANRSSCSLFVQFIRRADWSAVSLNWVMD